MTIVAAAVYKNIYCTCIVILDCALVLQLYIYFDLLFSYSSFFFLSFAFFPPFFVFLFFLYIFSSRWSLCHSKKKKVYLKFGFLV
ncbi:hypothetical protein BDA99DRAFT_209408 [Phascolomyces articulosus]|uniref:Uncharacterized protein n=1 Tax=Phascolomyces articulosus TaxID=60185 RepID=A0AAD5P9N3_9FUNG|nr:hypothetical protein BDA99DRAFT_209408 [Phascolomyces articulosus]